MAFMKVFKTNECQEAFGFDTVRRQIIKRTIFLVKMCTNINSIATVATKYAVDEIEILIMVDVSICN